VGRIALAIGRPEDLSVFDEMQVLPIRIQ
jgi:hypothetical protein